MNVSPLAREQGLLEDLMVANELRPDVLEIRSDQIPKIYYDMIQTAAEKIGCSLLLTVKQPTKLLSPEMEGLLSKVDYVDLDISYFEHEEGHLSEVFSFLQQGKVNDVQLIVSFHRFKASTREETRDYVRGCLRKIEKISERYGISVIPKIAVTPKNVEDALLFMRELQQQFTNLQGASSRWIGVPMGEESMSVRLLAANLGSMFTYAYLVEPNAPGQIPLYCLLKN